MHNPSTRLRFQKGKQQELLQLYGSYRNSTSQRKLAQSLAIQRSTLRKWINEETTLPELIFHKILLDFPQANQFKQFIAIKLPSKWGLKKGGLARKNQISNIHEYFEKLRRKKESKRIERHAHFKSNVTNPLVLLFIKQKIDLTCLLAVYILTDGSLIGKPRNYRIAYYAKDITLRNLAFDLLYQESLYVPSLYLDKKGVYSIRVSDNFLAEILLKLTTYKKIPSKNQTLRDYLNQKQPSLDFLKNTDPLTRNWSIRLALSTDGYISLSQSGNYTLALACYNPTLCKEWVSTLNLIKIKATIIKRKNTWGGVAGVRIANQSIIQFWEIGGFIPGVKISAKSKYYKGLQKNELLEKVVREKIMGP